MCRMDRHYLLLIVQKQLVPVEQVRGLEEVWKDKLSKAEAESLAKDDALQKFRFQEDNLPKTQTQLEEKKTMAKLENELRSKGEKIQELNTHQETLVAQHKQELNRQMLENRKLHASILESGQQEDPYDDQHFTLKFSSLRTDIQHLVKKHFSPDGGKSTWREYDNLRELDDRDFFLQAYVANRIAEKFFGSDARIFGLEDTTNEHQASFEKLLQDSEGKSSTLSTRLELIHLVGHSLSFGDCELEDPDYQSREAATK